MTRLSTHTEEVRLANTGEFTFRAFFMAAAHDRLRRPRFQTEWRRSDLLVQDGAVNTWIEFKYYVLRRMFVLDGVAGRYKGGAGPKNEAQFHTCVESCGTRSRRASQNADSSWSTSAGTSSRADGPSSQLRPTRVLSDDRPGMRPCGRSARGPHPATHRAPGLRAGIVHSSGCGSAPQQGDDNGSRRVARASQSGLEITRSSATRVLHFGWRNALGQVSGIAVTVVSVGSRGHQDRTAAAQHGGQSTTRWKSAPSSTRPLT